MEPSGPGGGPFGPWDPPPPPPNFAAPFPPPDAFHHHPSDLDYHHFNPFNAPPDRFNGPPDHFNAPPNHFNAPPDHFNGPPDRFNCPPGHFNGPPDHFNGPPDHFNGPPEHFNGPPDHFNAPPDHFNGPPDHFSGGGGFGHPKPPFFRKRKFDHQPDNNGAKLYVGIVPRTATQDEVRHFFEEFGNVIEAVILNDKKTGLQQEYCFVKYALIEEAERAIMALHNQITFPGALTPLRVKYAVGERERLGLGPIVQQGSSLPRSGTHSLGSVQHDMTTAVPVTGEAEHQMIKVYVNGLNREASTEEVKEIFSSYGVVVDIYILRDDLKRNRGCGFVGFTHRYMAVAAINGLNGTYVMRGCDMPLIVRFATPKKPKNGDSRPYPLPGDMQRNNVSSAPLMGNSSTCTSTGKQAGTFSSVANLSCPSEMQQIVPGKSFSPSRLSQMSLEESQTSQMSSQLSKQKGSKAPTAMHHDHQSPQACRDLQLDSSLLPPEPVSCGVSASVCLEASVVCDWSEHICPDGDKYYFNCMTSESRWEKPEEFALFERQMLKKLQNRSCAAEHGQEQVQVEANSGGGPACVQ